MKFFLKCNEAVNVCDKRQYKEASFSDVVALKIHLLLCSLCRGYSKRNLKLTKSIKSAHLKKFPPAEKQEMKIRLQEEIRKSENP